MLISRICLSSETCLVSVKGDNKSHKLSIHIAMIHDVFIVQIICVNVWSLLHILCTANGKSQVYWLGSPLPPPVFYLLLEMLVLSHSSDQTTNIVIAVGVTVAVCGITVIVILVVIYYRLTTKVRSTAASLLVHLHLYTHVQLKLSTIINPILVTALAKLHNNTNVLL